MTEEPKRRSALEHSASAGCAVLLTYLYLGYRYEVWPQPGVLESALRYDGSLRNDWLTSLPPAHWAMAHALGAVPAKHLAAAVFIIWILGLGALLAGVGWLCRAHRMSPWATLPIALVVFPTSLDGLGLSTALANYMYPTIVSFGFGIAALALAVRCAPVAAGVIAGISTVVHPGEGILLAAVCAMSVAAHPNGKQRLARLARYGVAFLTVAGYPLLRLLQDKALSTPLSSPETFNLVAIVRIPHHALFRVFPAAEYLHTAAWLVVLLAALAFLKSLPAAVALAAATAATLALTVAGGIAGELRGPLLLVEALTSRVTPLIVLLGVVCGAAAVVRAKGLVGAAAIVGVFLIGRRLGGFSTTFDASFFEAVLFMVLLGWVATPAVLGGRRLTIGLAVAAALVGTFTVATSAERHNASALSPEDAAWRDIATRTQRRTRATDIIAVPPNLDGFRMYARRPIVVDFGNFPYGRGDVEWIRRIEALTGDQTVLKASLGPNTMLREQRMAVGYSRTVVSTPRPFCRYGARFLVVSADTPPPPWLRLISSNGYFALYRLSRATC